jgi:lysophospholipase L1-like esterase
MSCNRLDAAVGLTNTRATMKSPLLPLRLGLVLAALPALFAPSLLVAAELETKPADAFFAKFEPVKAPPVTGLYLQAGDRLAICGDSITEQKMYSRIMETYLTVCVPQLKVTVRQYGWSGEVAEGFLHRMTNDCLRFHPTIATTCYGMNDHRYRAYDEANGRWYVANQTAIVRAFKDAGARVVLGSPGCVGKMPSWVQSASGTVEDLNLNLCTFRNLDIQIAAREKVRFADVFWPMFVAGFNARQQYGADYAIAGKDGVHPGWAGQLFMARAFLKAFGLNGAVGTITVDLAGKQPKATATAGHVVQAVAPGAITIESHRYPFCATGAPNKDDSLRSAMTLMPFNQELNRFLLVAKRGKAARYAVTWGDTTRSYSKAQLAKGVNLADDFAVNPFSEAFKRVDAAVAAKQNYETQQIKGAFHGDEGKADMEKAVASTEAKRQPLADAIAAAFVPVTHTIRIEAE